MLEKWNLAEENRLFLRSFFQLIMEILESENFPQMMDISYYK